MFFDTIQFCFFFGILVKATQVGMKVSSREINLNMAQSFPTIQKTVVKKAA